jgi:hypothetical protein
MRRFNEKVFNSSRPIVANGILHMPVIGHILHMLGAVRASPGAVKAALDKGLSLALAPGEAPLASCTAHAF